MSPKTSLAAATRFARLLNLSERRPELALRVGIRWLRDGGSPAMLEVFHRAVTILVEMAASREGQASDAVRSLIEEASALLADIAPGVREAADRELSFSISRPTARVSVSAIRLDRFMTATISTPGWFSNMIPSFAIILTLGHEA